MLRSADLQLVKIWDYTSFVQEPPCSEPCQWLM